MTLNQWILFLIQIDLKSNKLNNKIARSSQWIIYFTKVSYMNMKPCILTVVNNAKVKFNKRKLKPYRSGYNCSHAWNGTLRTWNIMERKANWKLSNFKLNIGLPCHRKYVLHLYSILSCFTSYCSVMLHMTTDCLPSKVMISLIFKNWPLHLGRPFQHVNIILI